MGFSTGVVVCSIMTPWADGEKRLHAAYKKKSISNNWLIIWWRTDDIVTQVERVVVHPKYNPDTVDNDMALLKLRARDLLRETGHLEPACLPVSDVRRFRRKQPTMCVVVGWGKVRSRDSYGSKVLQEARVGMLGIYDYNITRGSCSKLNNETRLKKKKRLTQQKTSTNACETEDNYGWFAYSDSLLNIACVRGPQIR